jgi:hypothetical protein
MYWCLFHSIIQLLYSRSRLEKDAKLYESSNTELILYYGVREEISMELQLFRYNIRTTTCCQTGVSDRNIFPKLMLFGMKPVLNDCIK